MQLHIFAYQSDGDAAVQMINPLYQLLPLGKLRLPGLQTQLPADDTGEILLFQHQGRFIQVRKGDVLDDAVGLDVAEQADFLEDAVLQRLITAQNHNVGLHTHALKLPDGVLSGLTLVLVGAPQEGNQGDVDKQTVFLAHLQGDLAHRLNEGLGLDIADGAADFGDDHVGIGFLANPIDEFLDLVGDVGDDLDGRTQVFAPAFLIQNVPVDLTCGKIGILVQVFVDEALIVPQIQIGFRAVFGDVNLSVLIGAHGARIHIDIGIQLLSGHLQPSGLEQPTQGSGGNALAQTGDHASCDKNILGHPVSLLPECSERLVDLRGYSHSTVAGGLLVTS